MIDHKTRRISDFWLRGGMLEHPAEFDRTRRPYMYAVEYTQTGPIVYRFPSGSARGLWVAQAHAGDRESLPASHKLVQQAKARDLWPDDGDANG